MAKTKTSTEVKARYCAKAYDRYALTLPKGWNAIIAEVAKEHGLSMNLYIKGLIKEAMSAEGRELPLSLSESRNQDQNYSE